MNDETEDQAQSPAKVVVLSAIISSILVIAIGLTIISLSSEDGAAQEESGDTASTIDEGPDPVASAPSEAAAKSDSSRNESVTAEINRSVSSRPNPFLVVAPSLGTDSSGNQQNKPAASAEVDSTLQVLKLERPGAAFAFDPRNSRLAVIEEETGKVSFYTLMEELKFLASKQAPQNARSICMKSYSGKSFFVVGGEDDRVILVFDAANGEIAGKIELQTRGVLRLAASHSGADPYVYYSSEVPDRRGVSSREPYIGRFSLATMIDEGALSRKYDDLALSSDGSMLYLRRTTTSPSGFDAFRIAPRYPRDREWDPKAISRVSGSKLRQVFDKHTTTPAYLPDPHGAYLAAGIYLYSSSLEKLYGKCDFPVDCFVPNTSWVVGIEQSKLQIASLNDQRTLKTFQLPAVFQDPPALQHYRRNRNEAAMRDDFRRMRRPAPVFYDSAAKRIVALKSDQLVLLSLSAAQLPDEPRLTLGLAGSSIIDSSQGGSVALDESDEQIKTRVLSSPMGVVLANGEIKWKPIADAEVGELDILVERSNGSQKLEQSLRILVDRKKMMLPFIPKFVRLSFDGRLAVVLGKALNEELNDKEGTVVAIVDTSARKLVASTVVEPELVLAMIHEDAIYALSGKQSRSSQVTDTRLYKFNMEDLSLVKSAEVNLTEIVLELLSPNEIYAGGIVFSLPGLDPVETALQKNPRSRGEPTIGPTRKTDTSWFAGGAVWDESFKRATMLFQTRNFITRAPTGSGLYHSPWGATFTRGTVSNSEGSRFLSRSTRSLGKRVVGVSPFLPAAFALSDSDRGRSHTLRMPIYDLVTGKEAQALSLGHVFRYRDENYENVDAAGEVIAACACEGIHIVRKSEINESSLTKPFRFRLDKTGVELATSRKATIQYELVDGKPPYDLELTIEGVEGTATSSNAATFRIDSSEITTAIADQAARLQWPTLKDATYTDPRDRVLKYLNAVSPAYRRLVGRNPKGVPVALAVDVKAVDATGKVAKLSHKMLLDVPSARIVDALANPSSNRRRPVPYRTTPKKTEEKSDSLAQAEERRREREQERLLDLQLAIAYSDDLRESYPHVEVASEDFEERAAAARAAILSFLQPEIETTQAALVKQLRTWSDRKGHKTKASLKSAFAGNVTLQLSSGNDVEVPLEKLSDQDIEFINQVNQEISLGSDDHAELQMTLLLKQVHKHVKRKGTYPPAFLVDEEGAPIFSWRVALLADMGGEEMLGLLKLDEPWDSEHNRRLVPFIPTIFSTSHEATDRGLATLHGIIGGKTILSDGRPLNPREIKSSPSKVVILTEVRPEKGVEWTRPSDLKVSQFSKLPETVRDRKGTVLVGYANSLCRRIPAKTDARHWLKAVSRSE